MDAECRKSITSEEYADFLLKRSYAFDDIVKNTNACYTPLVSDTMSVYIPMSKVPEDVLHSFGYGAIPNCYGVLDESSIQASGIDRVRSAPNLSLRGNGVLIGIVDTGIDYTLDTFRYSDGSSRIYSIWDQTIQSEDQMPERFEYGTQYTNEQINQALKSENPLSIVPSVDEVGHGTQLAGIAAGNVSESNGFSGVAPDSQIVVVKLKQAKKYLKEFWRIPEDALCFQKNDLMFGIRYLIEIARSAGRPISIIIGIGTTQGAHDDKGALSRYLSSIAALNGVSVTIAGGNEGNRRLHYSGTAASPEFSNIIELNVGKDESGFTMEIWGETLAIFSIDIISPSGEHIPKIQARLTTSRTINFIFDRTIIQIDYLISEDQSGVQLAMLRFTAPSEGVWRFTVFAGEQRPMSFHVWMPLHQFLKEETFFINPNPDVTLTSPGNTAVPMVTTAYDHKNNSIYLNASRGYTRDNAIAPSFAAPGVNLTVPAARNTYATATGTSLAAAHTAGIAALFLEWGEVQKKYLGLSTVQIKNFLILGAKRNENLTYPNRVWGYGIVDVYNAFYILRS